MHLSIFFFFGVGGGGVVLRNMHLSILFFMFVCFSEGEAKMPDGLYGISQATGGEVGVESTKA